MKKLNSRAVIVALVVGMVAAGGAAFAQQGGGKCSRGTGGGSGSGAGQGHGQSWSGGGQGQCSGVTATGACVRLNQRVRDGSCTNGVSCKAQNKT